MKTLLGKPIGLARAAEGNEDLLNTGTAALFAEALTRPDSTTAEKLTATDAWPFPSYGDTMFKI